MSQATLLRILRIAGVADGAVCAAAASVGAAYPPWKDAMTVVIIAGGGLGAFLSSIEKAIATVQARALKRAIAANAIAAPTTIPPPPGAP